MKTLKNALLAAGFVATPTKAEIRSARVSARASRDKLIVAMIGANKALARARAGKRSTKAAKAARAEISAPLSVAVLACRR